MAKYIAYSPNGTAFECDTLAEARSVEGKRRNPSSQTGLLKRMRDDGCDTFAKKVKWVRKHMPHIDDPQSFVGWVVKAERNPRRKVSAAQQSLFDAPVRSRRGASECGAVLVGKRWHSPPPAMADVTECASTLAHTRWGTKRRNPTDKEWAALIWVHGETGKIVYSVVPFRSTGE
jgi:hypothetical protein